MKNIVYFMFFWYKKLEETSVCRQKNFTPHFTFGHLLSSEFRWRHLINFFVRMFSVSYFMDSHFLSFWLVFWRKIELLCNTSFGFWVTSPWCKTNGGRYKKINFSVSGWLISGCCFVKMLNSALLPHQGNVDSFGETIIKSILTSLGNAQPLFQLSMFLLQTNSW